MLRQDYLDETVAVLVNALKLTPDQAEIASEAIAVAWEDKIAAVLTVDDVIELAKDRFGTTPTPEQAKAVLFHLDAEFDPEEGLTIKTIAAAIQTLGFDRA